METQVINATEYRNVSLSLLSESKTNPRRTFEEIALKELAESIRTQGVLSPLLVRPLTENGFEIVAGARRYRAAQMAELPTVPVRIVHLSDAAALEAQLVENLIRAEIHPMEEAQGFRALLDLEEPKYSIEQIAAKVGKSAVFVASRLKLTDLVPAAVDAFYADEIGVGHALLLAKLPADQQEPALKACFKEVYNNGASKPARILLPVRNLQFWIDSNILLVLKDAPFNKRDAQLVPAAGSCADCPKRTGHNKLLFGDDLGRQGDRCTDPGLLSAPRYRRTSPRPSPRNRSWYRSAPPTARRRKAALYCRATSTPPFGTTSRSRRTMRSGPSTRCASSPPRPSSPKAAMSAPSIRYAPIHPARCIIRSSKPAATMRSGRPNRRSSARNRPSPMRPAFASSPPSAPPSRFACMKRDLLFVLEKLVGIMDENRVEMLARQHGIRQKRDDGGMAKTFAAFLRRADEGTLSRLLVESSILLAASRGNPSSVLKDAATVYKVDTDAIAAKVKQEFAAKEKAKKATQPAAKAAKKAA